MYTILYIISVIIRYFYLSNPFEPLRDKFLIEIMGIPMSIAPEILNHCAGVILPVITFAIVGFYYHKGVDNPVKGCVLYLIFYCIHNKLLELMSICEFNLMAVIIILSLYISSHIGFNKLKDKFVCGI